MPQDKKQVPASKGLKKQPLATAKGKSNAAVGLKKPKKIMSEDEEYSIRSGIPLSEIKAQGGVTPKDVIDQIQKTGGYFTQYGPGAYKKPKSRF